MRAIHFLALIGYLPIGVLQSQVLAPMEIKDEGARNLQQKYFFDLKTVANNVTSHHFPYHFSFSRILDLSEDQQASNDQRAIQFDHFQGKLILKVTGNYFASYSDESMNREQRARQTFSDVMMPILSSAVMQLNKSDVPDSYALEISHHVRKKVLGVVTEGAENLVLVVPKRSANDLVAAIDVEHQNAALLNASAFVDGKPLTFWPADDSGAVYVGAKQEHRVAVPAEAVLPTSVPSPIPTKDLPSAESNLTLQKLQEQYQPDLERIVRELYAQAHFVTYAAPAFIEFHQKRYLQLAIVTTLLDQTGESQYQMAALSFDKHIAHLIRPVLSYLKNARDFDGIDFSTTIRVGADPGSESKLAVEYLISLNQLRSYEDYDCTGQQLLDASFVLINGERVGLNLQAAENR